MSQPTAVEFSRTQKQIEDFEQENPEIVEAMRLFGMSMVEYHDTLNVLAGAQVYVSSDTVTGEREDNDN